MYTQSLVAVIRRLPGGAFGKVPKSTGMPLVPEGSNVENFSTYFESWPKRKAAFLLYGQNRTAASGASGEMQNGAKRPPPQPDSEELHLYGPAIQNKSVADAQATSGAGSGDGAAAPKTPPSGASSKPLGLSGALQRFRKGQKLTMITAYDFPSSRFARGSGAEIVLVGDSLGNCRLGLPDTVGVTMSDMLRATVAVRRGIDAEAHSWGGAASRKPIIVGDMPFGSYLMEADALRNAADLRMAGADMVKLEGGSQVAPLIKSLTKAGIAVMAHVGLEPQKALLQGGLRLQGTTAKAALEIIEDAKELAAAGAVAMVVECVPAEVGRAIQLAVPDLPVIGIGAGGDVGGQVLVCDDMLGIHGTPPSFAKCYADLGRASAKAYDSFVTEVRSGEFPGTTYSRPMKVDELSKLKQLVPGLDLSDSRLSPEQGVIAATNTSVAAKQQEAPFENGMVSSTKASKNFGMYSGNGLPFPVPPAKSFDLLNGCFVPAGLRQMSSLPTATTAAPVDLKILNTRAEMKAWRRETMVGKTVAFVPTMGNLHEGHLELVDKALEDADEVLVSIFVNPSQFAAHEDFDTYPRTLEDDVAKLRARGVAAVFAPSANEMYPNGSPGGTVVVPTFVQQKSEDACRPHFFTGVATVCLKFFNICEPDVVVFGQKDAMQCAVIGNMLADLLLAERITLKICPTTREVDGLAMSSRNSYLTPGMRSLAPAIYQALSSTTAKTEATAGSVREQVHDQLESAGMVVEYVSVADPYTMDEKVDDQNIANSVVSIACLLKEGDQQCRLIDNIVVPAA